MVFKSNSRIKITICAFKLELGTLKSYVALLVTDKKLDSSCLSRALFWKPKWTNFFIRDQHYHLASIALKFHSQYFNEVRSILHSAIYFPNSRWWLPLDVFSPKFIPPTRMPLIPFSLFHSSPSFSHIYNLCISPPHLGPVWLSSNCFSSNEDRDENENVSKWKVSRF